MGDVKLEFIRAAMGKEGGKIGLGRGKMWRCDFSLYRKKYAANKESSKE